MPIITKAKQSYKSPKWAKEAIGIKGSTVSTFSKEWGNAVSTALYCLCLYQAQQSDARFAQSHIDTLSDSLAYQLLEHRCSFIIIYMLKPKFIIVVMQISCFIRWTKWNLILCQEHAFEIANRCKFCKNVNSVIFIWIYKRNYFSFLQ